MSRAAKLLLLVSVLLLTAGSFSYDLLRYYRGSNFQDFGYFIYQSRIIDTLGSPWDQATRQQAERVITIPHTISVAHYLPAYFIILIPFSRMPYYAAAHLWFFLSLAALVFTLAMCYRWFLSHLGGTLGAIVIFIVLHFYYSIRFNFGSGQNSLITLGLIALGGALLTRQQNAYAGYLAGIALGVAALFKIIPLVLFWPLLLRRAWKPFGAALVTFIILNALALVYFPPSVFVDFYESVRYKMATDAHCELSFSIYSLVWRLVYSRGAAAIVSSLIWLGIILYASVFTLRNRHLAWPKLLAGWCFVFMAGSAFLGESHLVYALPGIFALFGILAAQRTLTPLTCVVFGSGLALVGLQYYPHGLRLAFMWPFTFLLNMKLYGLLLLLGLMPRWLAVEKPGDSG